MSNGDGDNENDNVGLDRLVGEQRSEGSALQTELTPQRKVNEDLVTHLDEVRKVKEIKGGNEEFAQLLRKDEEIKMLKKENTTLMEVS
jgi:hypothetical protein